MLIALVGSAYVADPLRARWRSASASCGSTLGGYLVWIALRRAPAPIPAHRRAGRARGGRGRGVRGRLAGGRIAGCGPGRRHRRRTRARRSGAALAAGSPVARAALGAALALAALAVAPSCWRGTCSASGSGSCCCSRRRRCCATRSAAAATTRSSSVARSWPPPPAPASAAVIAASLRRTGDLVLRDSCGRTPQSAIAPPTTRIRPRTRPDEPPAAHRRRRPGAGGAAWGLPGAGAARVGRGRRPRPAASSRPCLRPATGPPHATPASRHRPFGGHLVPTAYLRLVVGLWGLMSVVLVFIAWLLGGLPRLRGPAPGDPRRDHRRHGGPGVGGPRAGARRRGGDRARRPDRRPRRRGPGARSPPPPGSCG